MKIHLVVIIRNRFYTGTTHSQVIFILFFLFLIRSHVFAQVPATAGLETMMLRELPSWLDRIPPGRENEYGFNDRTEFGKTTLGEPIMVYTFRKSFFSGGISPDSNYLSFTHDLRVPVKVGNENRALLTVTQNNGTWTIVDIGAAGLAREIQNTMVPQQTAHSSLKILRIFQMHSDFLFMMDPDLPSKDILLTPMKSAELNFPEFSSQPSVPITLSQLQQIVKSRIPEKTELYENK